MGGAETMYPEYRKKLQATYVRSEKCIRYCCGWEGRDAVDTLKDCIGDYHGRRRGCLAAGTGARQMRFGAFLLVCAGLSAFAQSRGEERGMADLRRGSGEHALLARSSKSTLATFKNLEVAWRFKTENLGPRPEFNLESDATDGGWSFVLDGGVAAGGGCI